MRVFFLTAVCLWGIISDCAAQVTTDTAKLFAAFKKVGEAYRSKGVSFDISYTYTSESKPGVVLDSMNGHVDMTGENVHYRVDSTETFTNGKYNVVFFKEDRIIYVSKPPRINTADPLQQLRTIVRDSTVTGYSMKEEGRVTTIRVNFNDRSPCKQMEVQIDKSTGYLVVMRYTIRTELLMEDGTMDTDTEQAYGQYAVVTCGFSGYSAFVPDSSFFDDSRFFYKEGSEFKSTEKYSDYRIYVGSPGL